MATSKNGMVDPSRRWKDGGKIERPSSTKFTLQVMSSQIVMMILVGIMFLSTIVLFSTFSLNRILNNIPLITTSAITITSDADESETRGISNKGTTKQQQQPQYYWIPSTPYYQAETIVRKESIGNVNLLKDPKRNPLQNCSPTVQYRLIISNDNNNDDNTSSSVTWTLQSYQKKGDGTDQGNQQGAAVEDAVLPKLVGGDELYVQWESESTIALPLANKLNMGIAEIIDHNNGNYTLIFTRPPMIQYNYTTTTHYVLDENNNTSKTIIPLLGRLTIYYEYTCGIGNLLAPQKQHYRRGGEVYTNFTIDHIPQPFINDFIPPNTINSLLAQQQQQHLSASDSRTATVVDTSTEDGSKRINIIDLSKYDIVIAFGDSIVMQFVKSYLKPIMYHPKTRFYKNVYQCLSTDQDVINILGKLRSYHDTEITNALQMNQSIALVTGTSSWDVWRGCIENQKIYLHLNAIRSYLRNVTAIYPKLDIYWKSPSPLFLHRYTTYKEAFNETVFKSLKPRYSVKPVYPRYINTGIPKILYQLQKELIHTEFHHIPFLDLYQSYYLSAPWTVNGDARHFLDDFTRLQLSYFWSGLDIRKPIK